MDLPRSGFRRAAAASWTLVGLGVAGVAGASALAYGDTVKPASADAPVVATDPAPVEVVVPSIPDAPQVLIPDAPVPPTTVVTTDPPAPVTPELTTEQAPAPSYTQRYTPEYPPQPTPAPATRASQAPSTPPTTKRRNLTPTTVMGPNYSPRITMSHGS